MSDFADVQDRPVAVARVKTSLFLRRQATRGLSRSRVVRQELPALLPILALILVFYSLPNLLNFGLSLTDWNSFRSDINFIGLDNFARLVRGGKFFNALLVTFRYALTATVAMNLVALFLALVLKRPTVLNMVLRLVFFIPVLISPLAAGYIFKGYLHPEGPFNAMVSSVFEAVGLPGVKIPWLGSTTFTIYVIGLIHAWKFGGFMMLVYIAGLQAIPAELLEAAQVEGAGPWQSFRRVTIPLLGPSFTYNITLAIIGALSIFDLVVALTKGGPGVSTEVLNYAIFRAFGAGDWGYATAVGTTLLIVIVAVTLPLVTVLRRREVEL
jgi:ABC-type sugar transport system permease subunit